MERPRPSGRGPFYLAFVVLHPPEGYPSGFGRENLEVEADAVAIFVLPSCADLEPEVVLPVLAFDDVKEGVRGLRHWTVLSLYRAALCGLDDKPFGAVGGRRSTPF